MSNTIKPIYSGRIISLGLEIARLPDGREIELEIVRHPGGSAVAAVDEEGRVCLLRQFRHAGNGWLWELPAGKIDDHEPPLQTARRELLEEGGIQAETWRDLGPIHSSPGVFDEVIHLYLATGLEHKGQNLEQDELLEIHWLPLQQTLDWAASGRITDAKTVIGLFRASVALGAG